MELNLEQIELVKDRTGVSYKEAKEALEFAQGNVVDAIIYIEENINKDYEDNDKAPANAIINAVKEAIKKGNVTKIKVYSGDDLVLNIPVTVGAIATLVFPWGVFAATVVTAASKCKVVIELEGGDVVDVNAKANEAYQTLKSKGEVVYDELKERTEDYYNKAKDMGEDLYEQAMDKGAELYEQAKAMGTDFYTDAVSKGEKFYEDTRVKVTDYLDKKKSQRIFDFSDFDFEDEDFEEDGDFSDFDLDD